MKTAEHLAHIREAYSEFCIISFCCIFIYFVIIIVLHMNNRSQLCSFTTLQFLTLDCYTPPPSPHPLNTHTHTHLRKRRGIMVSPCLSVDIFVSCSNTKAIPCRTKKFNSSVAHEPMGFPIVFSSHSSKVPVLLLFCYLIYKHGTVHTCCP